MNKSQPLPDKPAVQFGTIVREYRQCLGLSQKEFAARVGVKRSYLADVERGARNVSLLTIAKITDAVGLSFSTIFRELEQPKTWRPAGFVSAVEPFRSKVVVKLPTRS